MNKLITTFISLIRNFVYKKNTGVTIIEASIIMPVFLLLFFFTLELAMVHNTQLMLDSMACHTATNFMHTSTKIVKTLTLKTRIENSINHYIKIAFCRIKFQDIQWYFEIFPNISVLVEKNRINQGLSFITNGNKYYINNGQPQATYTQSPIINGESNAFTVTFICEYKFLTDISKKIFGLNARVGSTSNNRFLLWSKGVGIVGN